MSVPGHSAKSTPAQREEVRRLHETGVSIRSIARQVFGDERSRGRVERILKLASVPALPVVEPIDLAEFQGLDATAQLRLLVERRRQQWLVSGKAPPVGELKAMVDLERRLEARDQVERHRRRPG